MSKTVVVGGGVIGLLSAYELRRRGRDVVVLEKSDFCRGASSGNAGWVTPSLSGPVPAPGIVSDSLKWMLKPESPLYVRPGAVPKMAGWLLSFWKHCNVKDYRRGLIALAEFNRTTMDDFDALASNGIDFEMHETGLMYVCREHATIDEVVAEANESASYMPSEPVRMSGSEARELEPALRPEVAGAVLIDGDRHVRPESLLKAAYEWLQSNGVQLYPQSEVVDLDIVDGRVIGVRTKDRTIEADQLLVATGAESSFLTQKVGFNLPMQAGKGYSMTIKRPKPPISRSMYLVESRVALTPFDGAFRIAGTMELSGINTQLYDRRIDAMKRSTNRYLQNWEEGEVVERWVGMRPMLPDGLPAIGPIPKFDNVFVASGHAMLGITLGPTTAAAIAQLMVDGRSQADLDPFNPGRFKQ